MNEYNLILFNFSDTSNSASTKDIQNSSDQKLLYLGRSCVGYHTGKNIWIRGLIHRLLPQCATKTRFWYRETDVMKQAFVYFLNIIISCYVFSPSLWLRNSPLIHRFLYTGDECEIGNDEKTGKSLLVCRVHCSNDGCNSGNKLLIPLLFYLILLTIPWKL